MGKRRFLAGIFLALFAGLTVVSAAFFWENRKELQRYREVEVSNQQTLERKQAELKAQETRLERLRNDPVYVERELRRGMNYAKPDEKVFLFDAAP